MVVWSAGMPRSVRKCLDVPIGKGESQIPAHRTGNDGRFEVPPFEQGWSGFAHQGILSGPSQPLPDLQHFRENVYTKLLTLPGKPNPGFPLFPPPLGNLANPARFPHSHSSGGPRLEKWKTKIRFPTFPPATRDDDGYSFQKVKIRVKPKTNLAASGGA